MSVIAVINIKGGCGKTTTVANLSHALALNGKRVDVIDLDPQGHLSACLGATGKHLKGMDTVLMEGEDINPLRTQVRENLHLVPAGAHLIDVEKQNNQAELIMRRLRYALCDRLEQSDHYKTIIDTPSFPGILYKSAVIVADEIIIPVIPDYLALLSLSRIMEQIREIEKTQMKTFQLWLLIGRYQPKRKLAVEVRDKLMGYFPGRVLQTMVRECPLFAEAPSYRKTIFEYRPNCSGAQDYHELAMDLINERMAA